MAVPSQRNYDDQHRRNVEKYTRRVRAAYLDLIKTVSKYATSLSVNANGEFYWRNNPAVSKKVDKLLKVLYTNVYGITVEGINSEWDLAVEKNNELALYAFGEELDKLPAQFRNQILSGNAGARRNFVTRKTNGLSLSDRVWRNTRQLKTELELALEYGIGKGKSASSISRDIRSYLNEPSKLFRRVRDESGILRLSKAAKAYNPGQGMNRSSFKNAFRLAVNETNFSYEGSQLEKRNQQEFAVGVKIKVSPSHKASDDKGGISCLALQGNYPSGFNFTNKWHVNCKCTSFTILKTREELIQDTELILQGKEPNTKSKNEVTKVPKHYKKYISENKKKWENWKNQPRFVTNN